MKRSWFAALALAFTVMVAVCVMVPASVMAAPTPTPCAKTVDDKCGTGSVVKPDACVKIALPFTGSKCVKNGIGNGSAVVEYLKTILIVLSGLVGTVIVMMLIIAGIQYMTSLGDPGRIKAAKDRITNAIIALVLFLMMFAILGFLIPGGIL